MAEKQFEFKAASLHGEDNTIIIDIRNARLTDKEVEANLHQAGCLAEQLAFWLTPATTKKLREKLSQMDY